MTVPVRIAIALLLFFCCSPSSFAQQCDCGSEFAFLKAYIEKNYPGFTDKTPEYKGQNYKKITDEYAAKAAGEKNMTYCMMYMKEWLHYFKDNHLAIGSNPVMGNDSDILAERIRNAEIVEVSPDTLKKLKHATGVEGIYYEYDSVYKVAVIRSPNAWRTYAAVVLQSRNPNWKPGMVKFELKEKNDSTKVNGKWCPHYPCIFHMGNLGIYPNKVMSFSGYGLDGGIWKKEGLRESAKEQAERNKVAKGSKRNSKEDWSFLEFSKPDKQCAYLRISNFDSKVADAIDSFIKANDSAISNTPNLVLDLRDNGGGSDRSFEALLPYIYTNPIVTTGVGVLATRDNIDADKAIISTTSQEDVKKWLQSEVVQMEENFGRYTSISNDTFKMDSVKRYPQKIVILVNGNSASTTEQFLLAAQQSSKVTIMGKATSGTLDYSNKRRKKFPCMPYSLDYPISRSGRLPQHPIDNVGVKPAVLLPDDADWVNEARRYLEPGMQVKPATRKH